MGVFRQFPYSNFHEMNMDEIIKIVKNMLEEWAQYYAEWNAWMDQMNDDWSNYQEVMNEAWQNMQDFINNYFDNLDVQEEINNKITSMVTSGEFASIVEPYIPPRVTAWLAEHITQPVGVVIDTSLTVSGACADAKATGDEIRGLKKDTNFILPVGAYINENQWDEIWETGAISTTTGEPTDSTTSFRSRNFIPVIPLHSYYFCSSSDLVFYRYDSDKTFIANSTRTKNAIWTAPSDTYYIKLKGPNAYGPTYNYDVSLNYNSTDTLYHPASFERRHIDFVPTNGSEELITSGGVFSAVANAKDRIVYVSSSGNDSTGDGSISYPFSTVDKALEVGGNVILLSTGTYRKRIDLSKLQGNSITLACYNKDNRATFKDNDYLITNTETQESGYTKVYKVSKEITFEANNVWIYQEGGNDASTLIADADRLPQQRGLEYRCEDTKIVKCSADTLAGALTEIENSTDYKWFYDSDNHVLYFSRPTTVSSSRPITMSLGNTLFINNTDRKYTIKMYGIISKYLSININGSIGSEIVDCSVFDCYSMGGFTWDGAIGAVFRKCEACHIASGVLGDGFNAHSVTTGNYRARQTTATLIDCWSHDNNDDGYSDHERCEMSIIGGLFEYNGKGGVVPSYGSQCTCLGVTSRYNNHGFFYTGEATVGEGGKYGQMQCINCISQNNNLTAQSGGFKCSDTGNRMILVNCKSINDTSAYYAVSGTLAELTDCGAVGATYSKNGGGTFTFNNTALVS